MHPRGMPVPPGAPREWAERRNDVQRWPKIDSGGHFLEWEEPAIVDDILFDLFRKRARWQPEAPCRRSKSPAGRNCAP